ncbi:MAG: 4Fe-4S binding protein [Clostridiaceae bacterium]|nr:4Fe-4S binding protein [Clostridiaceae bacterium]
MAYLITDVCISCGSCESECPSGAISAGATQYNIDPDICIECGACEAVCPTQAIKAN